jgi:hypothetical protein
VCSLFEESPCGDKKGINKNPFSRSLSKYNNSKKKRFKNHSKKYHHQQEEQAKDFYFLPSKDKHTEATAAAEVEADVKT